MTIILLRAAIIALCSAPGAANAGAFGWFLWTVAAFGAFLTALYTFRLLFVVFWGEMSAFLSTNWTSLRTLAGAVWGTYAPYFQTVGAAVLGAFQGSRSSPETQTLSWPKRFVAN